MLLLFVTGCESQKAKDCHEYYSVTCANPSVALNAGPGYEVEVIGLRSGMLRCASELAHLRVVTPEVKAAVNKQVEWYRAVARVIDVRTRDIPAAVAAMNSSRADNLIAKACE